MSTVLFLVLFSTPAFEYLFIDRLLPYCRFKALIHIGIYTNHLTLMLHSRHRKSKLKQLICWFASDLRYNVDLSQSYLWITSKFISYYNVSQYLDKYNSMKYCMANQTTMDSKGKWKLDKRIIFIYRRTQTVFYRCASRLTWLTNWKSLKWTLNF